MNFHLRRVRICLTTSFCADPTSTILRCVPCPRRRWAFILLAMWHVFQPAKSLISKPLLGFMRSLNLLFICPQLALSFDDEMLGDPNLSSPIQWLSFLSTAIHTSRPTTSIFLNLASSLAQAAVTFLRENYQIARRPSARLLHRQVPSPRLRNPARRPTAVLIVLRAQLPRAPVLRVPVSKSVLIRSRVLRTRPRTPVLQPKCRGHY